MGRANYQSLFTYKAGFSSLPISFSNLWELGVCYIGVFSLHRKHETKSWSYPSRLSSFSESIPHQALLQVQLLRLQGLFQRQWWFLADAGIQILRTCCFSLFVQEETLSVVLKETLTPDG